MYVWYNGRRIKWRCITYERIAPIIPVLEKVSTDTSIPKFATHLVYVTRAKYKGEIESKIVYSLFSKQPKRADTYWFVYLQRSDEPYEFIYHITPLSEQKIFRIDIHAGFKLGFHMGSYIGEIAKKMESEGKVDLLSRYPSLRESGIKGDYRFMVVERIMHSIKMSFYKNIILSLYSIVKKFTTSDSQILDLDPSSVTVESVPLRRHHNEAL